MSVSNHEGINSSSIDKFGKSLLNNHEHSEGSEVNKPEKMHAGIDNHQFNVSISNHSNTLDNMLNMPNQVSSQVCSGSSVHCQLTNPLIRNREDNEADELNMQENMVHKEIQFTFPREDPILLLSATQSQSKIPIHGISNNHVKMDTVGMKTLGNDGTNKKKVAPALPTEGKLTEWFGERLVSSFTDYKSPERDGNCGFRALCMALGRNENEWAQMRQKLLKEIESNNNFYDMLFGSEGTSGLVLQIRHFESPAPATKWMDMPSTGFVFAQAFNVVLVHFSKIGKNCWTFIPSLASPPNAGVEKVEVIGIGFLENDKHYIKLDLRDGCSLPPIPFLWKTIHLETVASWESLLRSRFNAFEEMNIQVLQKYPGDVITLDGVFQSNVDDHDERVKSSRAEELLNLPESNHEGIDLFYLHNRMKPSLNSHEHSEGSKVNMPEKCCVSNVNIVLKETGSTCQPEQIMLPSDAAIESSDICFAVGSEFPNMDALRIALSDMAIRTGREYEHGRTSRDMLAMKCKTSGCGWYIRASRLSKNSCTFKVKKYEELHTCMVRTDVKNHPQATIKWIVSKVQASIERNPDMEPTKIVNKIKDEFGIKISINRVMKAKNEVKEGVRKRLKESLAPDAQDCLWLVEELKRGGSVANLGLNPVDGSFEYLFWAFSACIHALRTHLRPVLYVRTEDIALGVLMFAYGVDGNSYFGDFVEVGFAVFGREDEKAWETFMRCLKEFVLPATATDNNNNFPFAIVTDWKDAGICAAIERVLLPDIHHFFFVPDFVRVFSEKFKGGTELRSFCKDACLVFTDGRCNEDLESIKSMNEEAYEWLLQRKPPQWSVAFSPNKHVMADNVFYRSKAFALLLEKLLIVEIVESSRDMVAFEFSWRMEDAEMATTEGLVPRIVVEMEEAKGYLHEGEVEPINERKYQVTTNSYRIEWAEVDLEKRSCTCEKFQATQYPCLHAWMTLVHLELDPRDYVTHRWYSLETYQATYAGSLPPPIPQHISQSQTSATGVPFFPPKAVRAGRPSKIRRKSPEN